MPTWSVYNLGEKGVNLVKSPVHMEGGDLAQAQNAILDTNLREGALRKRPGLVKINSSALAGTVGGATMVPFGAVTSVLYAAIDASDTANTNTWLTSSAGATWAGRTTPARAFEEDQLADAGYSTSTFLVYGGRIASLNGKIYFPTDTDAQTAGAIPANPEVRVWDGTTDSLAFTIPDPSNVVQASGDAFLISDMLNADDRLYVAVTVYDSSATQAYCYVFQYNPATQQVQQVGPAVQPASGTLHVLLGLTWFQGKLWVGTQSAGGVLGTIRWIRPPQGAFEGDTSWTTDYTATSEGGICSMAVFQGQLYAGITNATDSNNVAPRVKVRGDTGSWSNSETGATSTGTSGYYSLMVYSSALYAIRHVNTGTPALTVRKYDGTSWSEDYDIRGNQAGAQNAGQGLVFNSKLFYVVPSTGTTAGVILENDAGVWTERDTGVAYRGYLALLQTGFIS